MADAKGAPAAGFVVGAEAKVDWKPEFCVAALPETQRGYGTPIYYNPNLGGVLTYGSGNLAFIRSAKNPGVCDTFSSNEHKGRITAVVVSPNGEWVASGDDKGVVLIWGSRPGQHNIKLKVEVNKRVWDICWSPDSQRVVAVGDGAESKAKCFDYATGNNFGTIDGHSQRILSVAFKPTRPFRVATTGEDLCVNFYEGPPFKWSTALTKEGGGHDRYPNCVRFHPSGNHYITVGSDSKVLLFDGKDGKMVKKIESKENHKSAITSVAWNPSGTRFLTSSMDKTCKLWSFDAKTLDAAVVTTFTFGGKKPAVSDMQVSTVWADDSTPISLALSGVIHFLDESKPDTPKLSINGHQKSARAFALHKSAGLLFTGDDEGTLLQTDLKTGVTTFFAGSPKSFDGGKGLVAAAVTSNQAKVVTVGLDDKYRFHDLKSLTYNVNGGALGGEPTGLAAANSNPDLCAVTLTQEKLVMFSEAKVLSITPLGYKPNCVSFKPGDKEVAVGGQDAKVRLYAVGSDGKVSLSKTLDGGHTARVVSVAYSPDGALIASADANRQIIIWKDGVQQNNTGWPFHSAAPADLAWASTGAQLASCALDQDIIVWSDLKTYEHQFQRIVLAHPGGAEHVQYASDTKLVSSGADRCVRTWLYKPA